MVVRIDFPMAEDLTKLWGKFSLSESKFTGVDFLEEDAEEIVEKGKSCLVGKLMANRIIGKDIIRAKLIRGWKPTGRMTFKVMGDNLFLLEFEQHWDKVRVLEGRPWIFEGQLFAVQDFDGLLSPEEMGFEYAAFWVRMFRLPLACMGTEMGKKLGATRGVVEDVDTNEEGIGWGAFLRVKVQVNVLKPLPRGTMLRMKQRSIWIPFQYEKVPKFCYTCGVIYHGKKGCTGGSGRRMAGSEQEYGPWLRVPPTKPWLASKKWWEREESSSVSTERENGSKHIRSEETAWPKKQENLKRKEAAANLHLMTIVTVYKNRGSFHVRERKKLWQA